MTEHLFSTYLLRRTLIAIGKNHIIVEGRQISPFKKYINLNNLPWNMHIKLHLIFRRISSPHGLLKKEPAEGECRLTTFRPTDV